MLFVLILITQSIWTNYDNRSSLVVEVKDVLGVINTPENASNLKVTYNNIELKTLYILKLVIKNNGRKPVNKKDIIKPILIKFDDNSVIISAKITGSFPHNINKKISFDEKTNIITTTFDLLNKNDYYEINVLTKTYNNTFVIDGHILGIDSIKQTRSYFLPSTLPPSKPYETPPYYSLFFLFGFGFMLFHLPRCLLEIWVKKSLTNESIIVPKNINRWETRVWIYREFKLTVDKKSLKKVFDDFFIYPDNPNFSGLYKKEIYKLMTDFYNDYATLKSERIAFCLLGLIGIIFGMVLYFYQI